jgi:hypothetical protein
MSQIACKYHPLVPARWECPSCHISLCNDCVEKDAARNAAYCPLCKGWVQQVSATNFITPFWKRIPKFFLFPMQPRPLIFMGVAAVLVSLLPLFGIAGKLLALVLFMAYMSYALHVLERTANGELDPAEVNADMFGKGLGLPLKQVVVLFILFLAIYAVRQSLGPFAAYITYIVVMLSLPASIMLLVMEDSLVSAVNPFMIVDTIKSIGMPYLVLYVFLLLLGSTHEVLSQFVASGGGFWFLPVQIFLYFYFTLVMYNMMGYVVFQYHEPLDFAVRMDVHESHGATAGRAATPAPGLPTDVEVLIKEGRVEEAVDALGRKVAQSGADLDMRDRYHDLLKRAGQSDAMARHGREHLNLLLAAGKTARAAQVFVDCFAVDPEIRPNDPDRYYELTSVLAARGAAREAVALSRNFHKTFAGHRDIPRLYLLVAKVLTEQLNAEQQAARILDFLQASYAGHPLGAEIRQYADLVRSLS